MTRAGSVLLPSCSRAVTISERILQQILPSAARRRRMERVAARPELLRQYMDTLAPERQGAMLLLMGFNALVALSIHASGVVTVGLALRRVRRWRQGTLDRDAIASPGLLLVPLGFGVHAIVREVALRSLDARSQQSIDDDASRSR